MGEELEEHVELVPQVLEPDLRASLRQFHDVGFTYLGHNFPPENEHTGLPRRAWAKRTASPHGVPGPRGRKCATIPSGSGAGHHDSTGGSRHVPSPVGWLDTKPRGANPLWPVRLWEGRMPTRSESLNHRISASYKQLTAAAGELNAVSDELGKFVTALDSALRRLNLGISTWLRLESREDGSGNYIKRDLGYAKVATKWGIALRTMTGNHNTPEDA